MLFLILKAAFIIPQSNSDTGLDNLVSVLKEAHLMDLRDGLKNKMPFCESGQIHINVTN